MSNFTSDSLQVEAHQFGGSTTEVTAFKVWMAGGEFKKPRVVTRDIRSLEVARAVAEAGDWIIKICGQFYVCRSNLFHALFTEISDDQNNDRVVAEG